MASKKRRRKAGKKTAHHGKKTRTKKRRAKKTAHHPKKRRSKKRGSKLSDASVGAIVRDICHYSPKKAECSKVLRMLGKR